MDGGVKRRLPSWMLGVAAPDEATRKKPQTGKANVNQNNDRQEEREGATTSVITCGSDSKPSASDPQKESSGLLVDCGERRGRNARPRKRLNAADDNDEIGQAGCEERKRRGKKSSPQDLDVVLDGDAGHVEFEGRKRRKKLSTKVVNLGDADDGHDHEPLERKRRRKLGGEDVDMDAGSAIDQRKRHGVREGCGKVESIKRQRKKEKSLRIGGGEDGGGSGLSEDADDLTMEDLLSIAKEYIQEEEKVGNPQSSREECFTKSQLLDTVESDGLFSVSQGNRKSLKYEELGCRDVPPKNSTDEEIVAKPIMSGSPTDDMLELFLGPLLKKTREEKKVEVITEDVNFGYAIEQQNQSVVLKDQASPLTKKKSSLKDKVAMFLD